MPWKWAVAEQSGPRGRRGSRVPRPALPERRGPDRERLCPLCQRPGRYLLLQLGKDRTQSGFFSAVNRVLNKKPRWSQAGLLRPARRCRRHQLSSLPPRRGVCCCWSPRLERDRLTEDSHLPRGQTGCCLLEGLFRVFFPVDRPFAAEIGKCPHPGEWSCVSLKRCRRLFLKHSISSVPHLPGQSAASCPSSKVALGRQLGGDQAGESPPWGSPAASCRAGPPPPPALGPAGSGPPAIGAAEQKNFRGGQAQEQNQHQPRSQPAPTSGMELARVGGCSSSLSLALPYLPPSTERGQVSFAVFTIHKAGTSVPLDWTRAMDVQELVLMRNAVKAPVGFVSSLHCLCWFLGSGSLPVQPGHHIWVGNLHWDQDQH